MPKRRTQEERRAETRQKLLEATIRSLVDHGYPATTGRRVAEIAEVSRGAQTHHYPQMFDLISDAVEHLADRRAAEMRKRAAALRGTEDQIPGLIDLLWEDFSSDLFKAVVKLWVAAADDPALRKRLSPLERHLRGVVRSVVDGIVGDLGEREVVGPRLDLVMSAIRGLALTESFEPRERRPSVDRWGSMRPILIELLESPT
ncbi:MAG: TetR family transcriptional regulator [Actinobacteria bacterium]|nr:TetR family transcriptional regulator [Actinomycetota bacterium]